MLKGQLAGLMRQAQAMQDKIKAAQDEVAQMVVTQEAGSGLVSVQVNGKHHVVSIRVAPSLLGSAEPDDVETLQDLLTSALNGAHSQIDAASQQRMSSVTAGMPLPPGMKF